MSLYKKFEMVSIALLCSATISAQESQPNWGQLSGSLESNSIYYIEDQLSGAVAPYAIGSNNYLKLNYSLGRFSAGMQAEYYPNVLQGFQSEFQGFGVPMKFVEWNDNHFSITAGDYYEQFGSG